MTVKTHGGTSRLVKSAESAETLGSQEMDWPLRRATCDSCFLVLCQARRAHRSSACCKVHLVNKGQSLGYATNIEVLETQRYSEYARARASRGSDEYQNALFLVSTFWFHIRDTMEKGTYEQPDLRVHHRRWRRTTL